MKVIYVYYVDLKMADISGTTLQAELPPEK